MWKGRLRLLGGGELILRSSKALGGGDIDSEITKGR